jgi:putative ABC transport system permease protein
VPATFAATGTTTLLVGGTYANNQFAGRYLVSTATYDTHFPDRRDTMVLVQQAEGANSVTLRRGLRSAVWRYPGVHVRDQSEIKADYRQSVNQLLSLVFGLLFLAILIAVLGIVNTLALSVFERTREIGLLRAVGMSRRQLRRMVRLESVTIAVFGALLGVALGVAFGWAVVWALRDEGIEVLHIPVAQLVLYLPLAAALGVLAAAWPARRAARMDVLRAITAE